RANVMRQFIVCFRLMCKSAQEGIMRRLLTFAIVILVSVTTGCQAPVQRSAAPPVVKHMNVNGVSLTYLEQGQGVPVVFVHGAISDHRAWIYQQEAVAREYRFIALDQRYFGIGPWPDGGSKFS